jgi:hypothetical protein
VIRSNVKCHVDRRFLWRTRIKSRNSAKRPHKLIFCRADPLGSVEVGPEVMDYFAGSRRFHNRTVAIEL